MKRADRDERRFSFLRRGIGLSWCLISCEENLQDKKDRILRFSSSLMAQISDVDVKGAFYLLFVYLISSCTRWRVIRCLRFVFPWPGWDKHSGDTMWTQQCDVKAWVIITLGCRGRSHSCARHMFVSDMRGRRKHWSEGRYWTNPEAHVLQQVMGNISK